MLHAGSAFIFTGTLENNEDPDEMRHHLVFHQDLHCLQRQNQFSWTEMHHNLETSMGKYIRIQTIITYG